MHVNSTRGVGGTERMLMHLIPNFDTTRFESCLVCFNSPSELSKELEKAGINFFHLCADRSISMRGIQRLITMLRNWKPDVLLVYGLRANLMARLAKLFYRVPVFITSKQGVEEWRPFWQVFLEFVTSGFVDMYIGVSQACCRRLAERERIPSRKLCVIPMGVDFKAPSDIEKQAEQMRLKYHLPDDFLIVGAVGRLEPVKGHHDLLAAAKIVLGSYPKTFFVFVGKDNRNGELQQMTKREGIEKNVLFAGYSNEISIWLKCFDIFVLPSLSEGMPVAAIEALFMKCPIIATDVGGTAEVVINKQTGLLVPPAAPDKLAQAIMYLIETPQYRQQLAEAGHDRAQQYFTVNTMTKRYEEVISKLYEKKTFSHSQNNYSQT